MKIYTISTTTFNTGINVSIRKTVATEKAVDIVAGIAFERFKSKVAEQPRFANQELRVCVFEQMPDENGMFKSVKKAYRDYRLIDGEMKMVKETIIE